MSENYTVHIIGTSEEPRAILCRLVSETDKEKDIVINCNLIHLKALQGLFDYISKKIQENPADILSDTVAGHKLYLLH